MSADRDTPARDTDRQSDLAVMDANEYKQKRRLERILDAMDAIPDQADKAKEEFVAGEIDTHARRIMVQDAVKDAIWEAWNLLLEHEYQCRDEADGDDWSHSEYFIGDPERGPIGTIEQADQENIVINGLRDFFEADELWVERWSESVKPRNCAEREVDRELTHSIPRKLSWKAALRLKEFLNEEHDLEIQFEALPGGEAEFDYSDIIDAPREGFDE